MVMEKIEGEHTNWYDAAKSGIKNSTEEEAIALKFTIFIAAVLGVAIGLVISSI